MTGGQLVIVDFRLVNPNAGVRPALIVQNDGDNRRINNTVVVQVTTNISRANLPTQLLIDSGHADWTANEGVVRLRIVEEHGDDSEAEA